MSRRPEKDLARVALEADPTWLFLARLEAVDLGPGPAEARARFEALFLRCWRAERALDSIVAEATQAQRVVHG